MVEGQLVRAKAAGLSGGNGTIARSRDFKLFTPLEDHKATFERILEEAPNVSRGNGGERTLRKAFETASQIFDGQKRKGGERDAIVHPLEVLFYTMVVLGGSYISGVRAMLHDAIEDGPKRHLTVNYPYLRQEFGDSVARGVAFLTVPKCVGPKPNRVEGDDEYAWVFATNGVYDFTSDFFKGKDEPYPPEVYREMRRVYFARLLRKEGISSFPIKLCDAISNLPDISALPEPSRIRKLEEDRVLIAITARMDWSLYELMAYFLRLNDITVPDFSTEIHAQQERGVIVCRSRDDLDFRMASEELPIQHPSIPVITVYMDRNQVHETGQVEIGLPRVGNSHKMRRLAILCPDQTFAVGRSLFHGYFDFGAKDSIYTVNDLSGRTRRQTERKVSQFLDRLRTLQRELAEERQLVLFEDPVIEPTGTDGE